MSSPPPPRLSWRSRVEHRSVPLIERLNDLPRAIPFVVILALFIGAAAMGPLGWVPLAVVAVFVAWLLFLTWPRLTAPERALRGTVLLMVVVAAIVRGSSG